MSKKVEHIYLSFSSMAEYVSCPRKWYLNRIAGLVPLNAPDESTGGAYKGTIIHECLDAIHLGKPWQPVFENYFQPGAAINGIPEGKSGSKSHIKKIIEYYIEKYNLPYKDDFEVLATEQTLELPLTPWLTYIAKIDKIVRDTQTDEIFILDHKTSSSLKTWVFPGLDISNQFISYVAAAQHNNYLTDKIIVDGISTALTSLVAYEKNPLDQKSPLFMRETRRVLDDEIAEWKESFIYVAEKLKTDIENQAFPAAVDKPKPCVAFGGKCVFYDVCASTGSLRTNLINNKFQPTQRSWADEKIIYQTESGKDKAND